jgi:hypothetical protein
MLGSQVEEERDFSVYFIGVRDYSQVYVRCFALSHR